MVATACGPARTFDPSRVLTIAEVIDNIDALNGKTARVAGYLGECAGYECRLFLDEEGYSSWKQYISNILLEQRDTMVLEPPALGIGPGLAFEFDGKAAPFTNSYVLITGNVTNMCRDDGKSVCLDRSADLEPIEIESWRRPDQPSQGSTEVNR